MATCTPSALIAAANCFSCLTRKQLTAVQVVGAFNAGNRIVGGGVNCVSPSAPNRVGVLSTTNTTITIAWKLSKNTGSFITGWQVSWGTTSGGPYTNSSGFLPSVPASYTITGLSAGITYFFVVQAVAFQGCTSANSAEGNATTTGTGICSQSSAWGAQIVSNGGSMPSNATLQAVCTYYNSLVSAGVDSLMIADILIPPDGGLIGSFTPFFHTLGNNPWTNHNFVAADLSASGLTGNGSSKYLDTGIVDNTAWASGTENGIAVYLTPQTNAGTVDTGSLDINSSNMSRLTINVFGAILANLYDNTNMSTISWPFAAFSNPHTGGFIAQVRQSGTRADIYAGNSVTAFSSLANTLTQGAGRPLGFNQFVFAVNNDGTASNFTVHQLQWVGIFRGAGMTLAKITALFNAVQALQVAFGRAQ